MKIELKHIFTSETLFSFDCEDNSIKKTLERGVKEKADLQGADLQGADLQGADLQGAYLRGADLQGAYLRGAYLRGADLQGAYLRGAYLRGADLRGADLQGAYLHDIVISKAIVITGLYKYIVMPIIAEDGEYYVKLGCHVRTVEEWEKDFWNNPDEFPNDGSSKSNLRMFAFETAKKWLNLNK